MEVWGKERFQDECGHERRLPVLGKANVPATLLPPAFFQPLLVGVNSI